MKKCTKRKHWPLINSLAHVIEGIQPTSDKKLNDLRTKELTSLEALAKGNGGLREWHDMTALLNLAETMARAGVGHEVLAACELAQAELLEAAERFERTRKMGLSASGLAALRELYEWHDLQRTSVPLQVYEKQIERAINIIKGKGKGVVEVGWALAQQQETA